MNILLITLIGLVNPHCTGLIGSGLVVHIPSFFAELDALEAQGECLTILLVFIHY